MSKAQVKIKVVKDVLRRRKKLWILPPLIMMTVSAIGAFMMPRMYESSIRILVQRSEVQNPLTSIANAMTSRDDDPLRSFDEIIFSQRTISALIDSLGLEKTVTNEVDRRSLMVKLRNNIQTRVQIRESFSITFLSDNPVQAQRGATVLADIFIQTRSNTKNTKNEQTVAFYQKKLDEYALKVEEGQKQLVSTLKTRAQGTPGANTVMYSRIEQYDQQLRDIGTDIAKFNENLHLIQSISGAIGSKEARQAMFELQRSDVPYGMELRTELSRYDDVQSKYTLKHPEVVKVENRLAELLDRIRIALTAEVGKARSRQAETQRARSQSIEEVMNSTIVEQQDRDKESSNAIYLRLYNEMKFKLEEAQISLAIGQDSDNQYMVIDPALVPLFPSKPSRVLIIIGGFSVGIVLAIAAVIAAELLDTTIRTSQEIRVYNRPLIALLPEADRE